MGIETSCDETSVAVVEDGVRVLSNTIASSKDAYTKLGGVIPEIAARQQIQCILPVMDQALKDAGCGPEDIDAIAVTKGPGLLGSLLVGTTTARAVASLWGKPLIGMHHTLGHLSSTWLDAADSPRFPVLTLSASGGHTEIWYRTSHLHGTLLGSTRDDAAGEAFDKGASLLGLPYPGGPSIAKAAEAGDEKAFAFPLPLTKEDTLDFSFSGLKTALKYTLRDLGAGGGDATRRTADLAASFQKAICLHLSDRIERALGLRGDALEVHLVGGVSANLSLRALVAQRIHPRPLRFPARLGYCTDNAAMIAAAGFFLHEEAPRRAADSFTVAASLPLQSAML